MRIGQLSKKYNVDIRTIDFYTKKAGILKTRTVQQGTQHWREYDEDSEKNLLKILILRDIGLSIKEIQDAFEDPSFFTEERMRAYAFHLKENKKIAMKRYDDMISFAENM